MTTTIWVCQNCYITHVNDEPDSSAEHAPLTKLEGFDVTAGIMQDQHASGCNVSVFNLIECDCAELSFSTSDCEGCQETLAGERYALTLWDRE